MLKPGYSFSSEAVSVLTALKTDSSASLAFIGATLHTAVDLHLLQLGI